MQYRLENLRCEYLVSPLAIDTPKPRLSWEGCCPRDGAAQTAYRVLVASSAEGLRANKGNLWDSGRVEGSQSLHITYAGKTLKSFQQVFWKVMVWDEKGRAGRWSAAATWTMGILREKEWQAAWIGNYLAGSNGSPLFRKEFKTGKKIRRALIHASALGLYHLTINGKAVHDDAFAPGWTDFDKRRYYRGYDVTALVKKGVNCIGAEIADGWYKGTLGWEKRFAYGNHITLLAQLRVEYEDGSTDTIATDTSWKSVFGHTLQAGFYEGESVDGQLEPKGWDTPGHDDSTWSAAVEKAPANGVAPGNPGIPLQAYPAEPVRATEELRPIKCWSVAPGKVIYDFGQNFAGRVRIHVKGKAGAVIRMRFGEMVNLDNSLYVDNLRMAISTDTYVMKGRKREVWEPKFTFHGFRYVEVSGCPVPPSLNNVTGVVLGSDTTPVGDFACSNPMLNQLYSNAVWTQRANFLEVPTDCPQRDERLGWTGDAQVFIRTAICNMDVAAFFTKWMNDLIDAQKPNGSFPNVAPNILRLSGDAAWGDAGVVCPWTLFECYEDRDLLEKMYPHMKRWVAYLKKTSKNFLRGPELTHCIGDWLSIEADTPKEVIQTAHFAYATDITGKAAEALGKKTDLARYQKLFSDIKTAFNKAYVKKDGKIHGNTQTGYLMAIKFGLLSKAKVSQAAKHLVADIRKKKHHSSTGFVGTGLILSVLRDTGNLDLAYRLLENTTFPSWGYSVVNGATTIWERWNGWTKENGPGDVNMNSYSHYAYGAVVEWMFDTVAGIDRGEVGFQHFTLQPRPGGSLKHAEASFNSPYGRVRSAWRKRGNRTTYEVSIPANTSARVILPVKELGSVKLNNLTLHAQGITPDKTGAFTLPAGEYTLVF